MAPAATSAAASWEFETEKKEKEAMDVPLHELVQEGAGLTEDKIGSKEHQDDDNARRGGSRELGGGRSTTGNGDRDRDGIHDLCLMWEKISPAEHPASRYSASGMFRHYTTRIFGSW